MSQTSNTSSSTSGPDDGPLADDPGNQADGRGVESTTTEEGTTFEPEEDPEGAASD